MTKEFLVPLPKTASPQKTLKNRIKCSGIGLHSGARISMVLHPAAPDTGIVFRRTDLAGNPVIRARHDRVNDTRLCTSIAENGASVATVEHLMAAFAGTGVDNVLVELDGPEVPVMDGSSAPFVFLLECADLIDQAAPRRYLKVLKPVTVVDGDRSAGLYPASQFSVGFSINFENPVVGEQIVDFTLSDGSFKAELARARTFGFAHEVDQLREMGLARGGSLDNAVVVSGDRVLNDDGLRYQDEFVRHKALDAIGDLYMAGSPLLARYEGDRSGHALNNQLLLKLFADKSAWTYVTKMPVRATVSRRREQEESAYATA